MLKDKIIALDFDGVLNQYQGWTEGAPIPEPMPGAFEFLQTLAVECGARVIIFTCRAVSDVWKWLHHHQMVPFVSNVTNLKPPAYVYVDDRAICFRGNFESALKQIHDFEPHWKKDQERLWISKQHD